MKKLENRIYLARKMLNEDEELHEILSKLDDADRLNLKNFIFKVLDVLDGTASEEVVQPKERYPRGWHPDVDY